MAENKVTVSGGTSFLGLLTIVFIVLKLTGVISWSWWLVLLPTLIPTGIVVLFVILWLVLYLLK